LKKISYWIRNYFGFSQKETSGFIVIIILILFFLFLPLAYKQLINSKTPDYTSDQRKLDSLIIKMEENIYKDSSSVKQANLTNIKLFPFDPNSAGKEEMLSLGFEKRMAERIINFRNKGGTFRIKKDLLKIYGLPNSLFLKLQHFILLPDSLTSAVKNKQQKKVHTFDINKTDTSQLNFLKGIGSILASRIIKYRDKLGGFISKDQFKEVYGLSPLALDELNKYAFIINDFTPQKIKINSADQLTLSAHPYITNKMAAIIINYRKQHGLFKTEGNIREMKSISPEEIKKVLPYLNFNPDIFPGN
jgi:competence protein ComEA